MEQDSSELERLRELAMLRHAERLLTEVFPPVETPRRFGFARARDAVRQAAVWYTAYPSSTLHAPGESVAERWADPQALDLLAHLGVTAIHTGPIKRGGGYRNGDWTPSIDGDFDRCSFDLDPEFGDEETYRHMIDRSRARGITVIGDLIPGHTGKGPDWRLAERGVAPWPGLFYMIPVDEADWNLLPEVPEGHDSVNLPPEAVDLLTQSGYLPGRLPRVIFAEPGIKDSNYSCTPEIRCVDGIARRWVYLHYFKDGQPSLRWLHPSMTAARLVLGDAVHSLYVLGEGMLRLDANGFLGLEPPPEGGPAFAEGHPLSRTVNELIAGMVRRHGGFSFQELNLSIDDLVAMGDRGADLSYDFVTRPAVQHALVTGNCSFLRLMLAEMVEFGVDPASLVHALQNHDELTMELVHFWSNHANDRYTLQEEEFTGIELREKIREELATRLLASPGLGNLPSQNGIACTMASLCAAALGLSNYDDMVDGELDRVRRAHLLLAAFNALLPGVFAISGWDIVGAVPLAPAAVVNLLADGDTRWVNRGAYGLRTPGPEAQAELPAARSLYGSLEDQLSQPGSFANRLRYILEQRGTFRIAESEYLGAPDTGNAAVLSVLLRLPDEAGVLVCAFNFSAEEQQTAIGPLLGLSEGGAPAVFVRDILSDEAPEEAIFDTGRPVRMGPHNFRALLAPGDLLSYLSVT